MDGICSNNLRGPWLSGEWDQVEKEAHSDCPLGKSIQNSCLQTSFAAWPGLAWPLRLGPVAPLGLDRGAMSLTGKTSSGVQHEGGRQAFLCSWNTGVYIV